MANFGTLGTLRHADRTLNKPLDLCPSPISLSEQEFSEFEKLDTRHGLQRNGVARGAQESSEHP
jgi:hypothetical protein